MTYHAHVIDALKTGLVTAALVLIGSGHAQDAPWRFGLWTDPASGEALQAYNVRSHGDVDGIAVLACTTGASARPVLALAAVAFQEIEGDVTVEASFDGSDPGPASDAWERWANGAVARLPGPSETFTSIVAGLRGAEAATFVLADESGDARASLDVSTAGLGQALDALACM